MTHDQLMIIESVCNAYAVAHSDGVKSVEDRVSEHRSKCEHLCDDAIGAIISPPKLVGLYLAAAYRRLGK